MSAVAALSTAAASIASPLTVTSLAIGSLSSVFLSRASVQQQRSCQQDRDGCVLDGGVEATEKPLQFQVRLT